MHMSNVASLDEDFSPVLGLCKQIAEFLENTLDLSWTARRFSDKADLCTHAKSLTNRVDEINCQVLIKLNVLARSHNHYPSTALTTDDPIPLNAPLINNSWKLERRHIRGILFFLLIVLGAVALHFYDATSSEPPIYLPKSHYADRADIPKL